MSETNENNTRKQSLYVIIAILVVASIAFRLISDFHLEQYSILFIGLPALLAILLVRYSKTPKSAYGVVFKTITLFLLLASILFGEGLICILMASPLFYGVGALVVFIREYAKKKGNDKIYSFTILPIIILLAQPFGNSEQSKLQEVSSVLKMNKEINLNNLSDNIVDFDELPNYLQIGFPKPLDIVSNGTAVGDTLAIRFKSSTKGVGTLVLQVKERSDMHIVYIVKSDNTHIDHWLTWKSMRVKVNENNQVVWTSNYSCDLGPGWYFKPIEKYTVGVMNEYLINLYFK